MARPVEKREHIEAGLVRAVARRGLLGTTIQDIAREADVSPGLLYRYWKDREDLARDVYRRLFADLMGRLLGLAGTQGDTWGKLRVMIRAFLEYADQNPVQVQFLLLTQHDLKGCVPKGEGIQSLLSPLVQEGLAQGAIRPMHPALVLQFLLGIVVQVVVGGIYGDVPGPLAEHADEVFAALRRALAPDATPAAASPLRRTPRRVAASRI